MLPLLSSAVTWAEYTSSRSIIVSTRPCAAARCSGVRPREVRASMEGTSSADMSTGITAVWPRKAAACRGSSPNRLAMCWSAPAFSSSVTTSTWPLRAARASDVLPSTLQWFSRCASDRCAECLRNHSTVSMCPWNDAICSPVLSCPFMPVMSAPRRRSVSTHDVNPRDDASTRGVLRTLLRASSSAPNSTRALHTSTNPWFAAKCRGVSRLQSRGVAVDTRPDKRMARTAQADPPSAA
mmetsp:Transcript_48390/g.92576  ORF Transcript_48390/g.92576 Transcript_48390/m.92576 type:complete len:239 (-) Transcript_48390:1692-2408(-)